MNGNGWETQNVTKHIQIMRHIEKLHVGKKISVRGIAKELDVSEGTAYRAIKEAEKLKLVSTKERIGTVRIEKQRHHLDLLTFADVTHMVEGRVLGGSRGLEKTLHKFVIGAMEQEAMLQYIEAGSLLIVGNRESAHRCALEQGSGVLITGGFDTAEEMKLLADEKGLPVISSEHDTFTVASMINRALYDRMIKTNVKLIEDLVEGHQVISLKAQQTILDWRRLFDETGYSRFPVVDEWQRIIGMVTAKDVVGASPKQMIEKVMTRQPNTVQLNTSIATAAHLMVWEGIELLPVVDHHRKLVGVISRKDVLQAMQLLEHQPQMEDTFENSIWSQFREIRDESSKQLNFVGQITPQMTSHMGTVSEGVLATLITRAAYRVIKEQKKVDLVLDNVSTYFIRPVQIEAEITIQPRMIELSRKFGKVDVEIYCDGSLVCKAMLTAQVLDAF